MKKVVCAISNAYIFEFITHFRLLIHNCFKFVICAVKFNKYFCTY